MSFVKSFTQGGQITLHNWRMIRQVLRSSLLITMFLTILLYGFLIYREMTPYQRSLYPVYGLAYLQEGFIKRFSPKAASGVLTIPLPSGRSTKMRADVFLNHPYFKHHIHHIHTLLQTLAWQSLYGSGVLLVLLTWLWIWRGYAKRQKEVTKGQILVDPSTLNKGLRDKSPFTIAKAHLPFHAERQHMLLTGTTGAGKTNCLNELLPQIRALHDKVIIVDSTGLFVDRYYNPETDVILNPFDTRTAAWDVWQECDQPYHFDAFAENLIPQSGNDPFWANAARTIFSATAQKLSADNERYTTILLDHLLTQSLNDLFAYLQDTMAAPLVDPKSDRTAVSIRSYLVPYVKAFSYLEDEVPHPFSIKRWLHGEPSGWLFLSCSPEQRETMRPLLTAWMGQAASGVMSLDPDPSRRIWLIMDELASLHKLPALAKVLAEGRKYGACVVAGLQDTAQAVDLYGHALSRSIIGLFNTKITFRLGDAETARMFAQIYGEHEVLELSEGVSYGANEVRDGVSLNDQKKLKPLVSQTDFIMLPNLEAYMKLPGNYPVTHLRFDYWG